MARLESGAATKLETAIEETARDQLDAGLQMTATQHAPGSHGLGVESVIVEVIAEASDDELQEGLLDRAEHEFVGGPDNLISQTIQETHESLRRYGSSNDYSVQSVENSFQGVEVGRSDDTLTIGYGWDHVATAYFERGVSPHMIHGQPVLVFVWENPPAWAQEAFDPEGGGVLAFLPQANWGSDTGGIPEGRFVRDGINWLRREVS